MVDSIWLLLPEQQLIQSTNCMQAKLLPSLVRLNLERRKTNCTDLTQKTFESR